jgi:hypothetical protein
VASHDEIVDRWLDVLEGREVLRRGRGGMRRLENFSRSSNVYGAGDRLFSYGSHFTLARYLPAGTAGRSRPLYLLNGDRVSVSTARHQRVTRDRIETRAARQGADVIILPFSALEGAGILPETVRPLEVRPDRNETLETWPLPEGFPDLDRAETADPDPLQTREWAGRSGLVDVTRYTWRFEGYRVERTALEDGMWRGDPWLREKGPGCPHGAERLVRDPETGGWLLARTAHRLGDSLFLAEVPATRTVRRSATVADVVWAARQGGDALERLDTRGGGIVERREVRRRRRYVSSFDPLEPRDSYFLATLPPTSRAETVRAALEDLAPPAVHAALARGREVYRQGDIFAIETDLSTEEVYGLARTRARLTLWTRDAKPREGETGYLRPLSKRRAAEMGRWRRREWRRRFRISQAVAEDFPRTPPGRPHSGGTLRERIARERAAYLERAARYRESARAAVLQGDGANAKRARESLAFMLRYPPTVDGYTSARHARDRYRGDPANGGLARARSDWTMAGHAALERFHPGALQGGETWRARRERIRRALLVHGTIHSATEVVHGPGGTVYLRGTMRHVPGLDTSRRGGADHVPRKLGDGTKWFLAVRNTVPRLSR